MQPTAVFLDRDGTIIRDTGYMSRPDQIELLAGASAAVSRLNELSIPVVVITNQSGIARGLLSVSDYMRTQARLDELLDADGAHIDATYYCPDHPDVTGPCDCRKPGIALHARAVHDLDLNMHSPAFVGDRWRDVSMYATLGGTPILIRGNATPAPDVNTARADGVTIVESLAQAVDVLLGTVRP